MGLLTTLLTFPVSAPAKTAWWIAEKIHEQALATFNDPSEIKRELVRLESLLDAGEIDEETFEELETALLIRLRDARKAGAS